MYTLYSTREWKIERENKTRYSSISTNIYVRSNERMNEFFFFFDNSFGGYDEDRWNKRKKGGKEGDYAKDPRIYIYIYIYIIPPSFLQVRNTFVQVGTGRNETARFPSTTVVC